MFTTQPRSKALCREIAADATIAVSLIRKVTVNIQRPCTIVSPPYSAPVTHQKGHGPPSAWTMGSNLEEGDSRSTAATILKRIKSTPPRLMKSSSYTDLRSAFSVNKELPALPPPSPPSAVAFTEARTLQTRMSIGFPKRPRSACAPDEHPSLEAHTALPDGLHKGRVDLNPQLLPSIDWAGLNVKVSYLALGSMGTTVVILCMCADHGPQSRSITSMSRCFLARMNCERGSQFVSSEQGPNIKLLHQPSHSFSSYMHTVHLRFAFVAKSFFPHTDLPCIIIARIFPLFFQAYPMRIHLLIFLTPARVRTYHGLGSEDWILGTNTRSLKDSNSRGGSVRQQAFGKETDPWRRHSRPISFSLETVMTGGWYNLSPVPGFSHRRDGSRCINTHRKVFPHTSGCAVSPSRWRHACRDVPKRTSQSGGPGPRHCVGPRNIPRRRNYSDTELRCRRHSPRPPVDQVEDHVGRVTNTRVFFRAVPRPLPL